MAQDNRKILNGKLTGNIADLEGIYIVNMQTEKGVLTASGGYFSLVARPDDSLMLSSIQIKGMIVTLEASDFAKDLYFIKVDPMVHALDEVMVMRYDNLDAYSLGIVQKKPKSYTPAERRLQTAGDLKPVHFLGLLGGSMPVDPIINAITGRTAMLKKQIEVEKKEYLIDAIAEMYEEKYFIDTLKIPSDYLKGFLYYLVENDRFVMIFKSKNKSMAAFIMGELAVAYNETITREGQ